MRYNVDSSVAAKWVIPETDSDKALRLLDEYQQGRHELLAPDWLLLEVANILGKAAVVRKILTPEQATEALLAVQGLALKLFPSGPLTTQALDLAMTHHRAVYDCLYLALAINEGGQLVTADQPVVNQLRAVFPFVVSVSDLPS